MTHTNPDSAADSATASETTLATTSASAPATTDTAESLSRLSRLTQKTCVPCEGGVPPLTGDALQNFHYQLGHGWEVVKGHHLEKKFVFPDFATALAFTNKVAAVAEAEGHHPDIHLAWGKVRVVIWTHKIDGLTESDFVLAAKVERLERDV